MLPKYIYCPRCANEFEVKKDYFHCDKCKFNLFPHSAATSSIFIVKDGKVLLTRRKEEPQKGKLDTVGGFLKYGEHPKDAAIREALEETGLKIKIMNDLPIYMDKYLHQGDTIPTLNFSFLAEIIGGKMEAYDDVAELIWYPINEVPDKEIGFDLLRNILKDLKKL